MSHRILLILDLTNIYNIYKIDNLQEKIHELGHREKSRKVEQMSKELFHTDGKRKYLTQDEQDRFLKAASNLDRAEVRTFCMTLAYTGCRISEALALTVERVDLSAQSVRFRTLKQRGKVIYRAVPVPDNYLDAMKLVHSIQKRQKLKQGKDALLWDFKRTMAHYHVKNVMEAAEIDGLHASAKGLRHGFGVRLGFCVKRLQKYQ